MFWTCVTFTLCVDIDGLKLLLMQVLSCSFYSVLFPVFPCPTSCSLEHTYCFDGGLNDGHIVAYNVAFNASCLHSVWCKHCIDLSSEVIKIFSGYICTKACHWKCYFLPFRTHSTIKHKHVLPKLTNTNFAPK